MDVYEREIPKDSLDIYMTSPPCQAFSLAGKKKGEEDKRGVLFYNSHEFIQKNKPRYFIFENVKGLLSDDGGKTFQRWIFFLGGKSVNGNPVIFPLDEATPYHVYYQVLNAKNYGIPQNRERIFIIGVRDDADNDFSFPKPFHLVKRLKDVLESEVDEKYFLSDKMIDGFLSKPGDFGQRFDPKDRNDSANCITSRYAKMAITDNYITDFKIGAIRGRNPNNPLSRVSGLPTEQMLEINENGTSNALTTVQKDNVVVIGFERTEEAKIKRKQSIANGKDTGSFSDRKMIGKEQDFADTLLASPNPQKEGLIMLSNEVIQLNPSTESGGKQPFHHNRVYDTRGVMTTLDIDSGRKSILNQQKIRRLTPRECFRLMDFPETFKWDVSDSQSYKQAGNSICVGVLYQIIKKLIF
jgi:DNA (cytosine-5)-methyltransferase 1